MLPHLSVQRPRPALVGKTLSLKKNRHLNWDGCFNVRDLGGFRTVDGRMTRSGAVVRSDSLDRLSAAGWAALQAFGIRTIVDLRNDEERTAEATQRAPGITGMYVPLDDVGDTDFWEYCWANELDGTPLYYGPFLDRKPERCAAAIAAIAHAPPGGVLIHCGVGRDRTGLITLLLLALVGVSDDDIAADYELSADRLRPLYKRLGEDDFAAIAQRLLACKKTTAREAIFAILRSLDAEEYLLSASLSAGELTSVRTRLVEPS
jgi:protein-tyrosine phosphatase